MNEKLDDNAVFWTSNKFDELFAVEAQAAILSIATAVAKTELGNRWYIGSEYAIGTFTPGQRLIFQRFARLYNGKIYTPDFIDGIISVASYINNDGPSGVANYIHSVPLEMKVHDDEKLTDIGMELATVLADSLQKQSSEFFGQSMSLGLYEADAIMNCLGITQAPSQPGYSNPIRDSLERHLISLNRGYQPDQLRQLIAKKVAEFDPRFCPV
jgi:hypothetical protein